MTVVAKLGPHGIKASPDTLVWARVAPVVKALDDAEPIRQAAKATIRIYRRYFPNQDVHRNGGSVVQEVLQALGTAPATHIELYNECFQRLGQGLQEYVAFTWEATTYLERVRPDLALVGFCFSTGNPEQTDWEYLRENRYGGAKVIGLHEYWGAQGFSTWNALRYRRVHEWTQGDHPPFLVTECGRDRVEGGHGGWKADGLTEDAYLAELRAYEAELMRDPYVLAATPFTCGPTPDWASFDMDPFADDLAATTGPLPTPPPQEPTVPDVVLSVPMRHSHAAEGNWGAGEPFGPVKGVVIHSTGGSGTTLENEYTGTINWFQNPAAGVSAHVVIGAGKFAEVCRVLGDLEKAYHAREPSNTNRRGIEFAHPDGWDQVLYPDSQYEMAGELIARWKIADAARGWVWPIKLLTRNEATADAAGIVFHRDLPAGINDGRRDPTPPFNPTKLLEAANRWHAKLTGGTPVPTPPTETDAALLDRLYALAGQIQALEQKWAAINCPHRAAYVSNEGEAIKEFVNACKGQK